MEMSALPLDCRLEGRARHIRPAPQVPRHGDVLRPRRAVVAHPLAAPARALPSAGFLQALPFACEYIAPLSSAQRPLLPDTASESRQAIKHDPPSVHVS